VNQAKSFEKNPGTLKQIGAFLWQSKKWYLAPVAVVMILMSLLVMLGGTAAAPFIYSLF
jgi:Family of unknown function (DUF5989)